MNTKEIITSISQGNIGVITFLCEIAKEDPSFLNRLYFAIESTNSKSYAIWIVYKDLSF